MSHDPAPAEPVRAEELSIPSLRGNSVARLTADLASVVLALLAGVVTARWLGPGRKGLFSSLTVLSGLFTSICSLSLAEAAIILVGRKQVSLQKALSSTVSFLFLTSAVGAGLIYIVGSFFFALDRIEMQSAVLAAALSVPLAVGATTLLYFLIAQERIGTASIIGVLGSAVGTFALIPLIVWLPLGVLGGALSTAIGAALSLILGVVLLRRSQLSFRPSWDWLYLRTAFALGLPLQASVLLTLGYLRGDVLLVLWLGGSTEAGLYSVALTAGSFVALPAIAISTATFPRLASMNERRATELMAQSFRVSVLSSAVTALGLLVVVPFAIPGLFGREFVPAIGPAMVSVGGGVFWSALWILCRSQAARGRPNLQVRGFSTSLIAMCLIDIGLIPLVGILGAALGSMLGSLVGLVQCLIAYRRAHWWTLPLEHLIPTSADVRALTKLIEQWSPLSRSSRARS